MVLYTISIRNRQSKIDWVVMGVYSGWDSLLLKYGGEVLLERHVSPVLSVLACSRISGIRTEVICSHMCLCNRYYI